MKNSKKFFGLFAFLLVCGNVNADLVFWKNVDNQDVEINDTNININNTDGGNIFQILGDSYVNIKNNLNFNIQGNIITSHNDFLSAVYLSGDGNGHPIVNAKNLSIYNKITSNSNKIFDGFEFERGGGEYTGKDINIKVESNPFSVPYYDITGISIEGVLNGSYGTPADTWTYYPNREFKMTVENTNIDITNNMTTTVGPSNDEDGIIGISLTRHSNITEKVKFESTGNVNIKLEDNNTTSSTILGLVVSGEDTKMTLNNSNINLKSNSNDIFSGAIMVGDNVFDSSERLDIEVATKRSGTLESKGRMIVNTENSPNIPAINMHGVDSIFKADFENSSSEIKSGGIAIKFNGKIISNSIEGKNQVVSLKNAKITSSATNPYSSPLIKVEDGVQNATFNLTGSQSEATAPVNNDLLLIRGNSSVTLNISDGAKINGIISRAVLGEITTNITNGAVWASPANRGSSYASTLTLKDGGTFDLSDNPNPSGVNYHEIKLFSKTGEGKIINDNGVITMANTSYNDVVEIYGNYEGRNGAKIKMNTQWNSPGHANGANSKSDVLKILEGGSSKLGTATGVTGVIPVGIDGKENIMDGNIQKASQALNTIPVIIVDHAAAGTFVGKAQTTGAGEIQLTSRLNGGGQREFFWTLNAIDGSNPYDDGTSKNYNPYSSGKNVIILNSAVAGYINTVKVNMDLGFDSLSTLHERRGENNINLKDDKSQAWVRIIGKHTKDEGKERFNTETDVYGVQAGYDFSIKNSDNGKRYTGFYFANTEARTDFYDRYRAENGFVVSDKYTGKAKVKDFTLGLSTTKYYNNGMYLDLVGQFSFIKNKYNSRDGVSANQKGNAFGLSAETGKNYRIGTNWRIEPQVQLAYQYLKLKDFKDDVREVHYGSDSVLRARMGVRATYKNIFYSVANIWHDFSNTTEANIGSDLIKEKYSSTWGELGLGIQIPVTNSAYVYTDLRYERSFKSNPKHKEYRGTVGFKYTF